MDLRILQSIPTPVADALLSRGCKSAADVISRPESLTEACGCGVWGLAHNKLLQACFQALMQHHIAGPERASNMLAACRREAASKDAPWHHMLQIVHRVAVSSVYLKAWSSADSALSLLRKGHAVQPLRLPSAGQLFCK